MARSHLLLLAAAALALLAVLGGAAAQGDAEPAAAAAAADPELAVIAAANVVPADINSVGYVDAPSAFALRGALLWRVCVARAPPPRSPDPPTHTHPPKP